MLAPILHCSVEEVREVDENTLALARIWAEVHASLKQRQDYFGGGEPGLNGHVVDPDSMTVNPFA